MPMSRAEFEQAVSVETKKQIDSAKEDIKKELGGLVSVENEAKINEAVAKAIKNIQDENEKNKNVQFSMLDSFEKAVEASKSKNILQETSKTIIDQMIGTAMFAMEQKKAVNASAVNADDMLAVAKKMYPESKALHGVLLNRKELSASVPADGGFTIPTVFSSDYIKMLYANTILDKLGIRKVPMPNGNFTIPKMTASSSCSWVEEDTSLTETQPTFGAVSLRAKKLSALTAVSNTLLRQSGVGIESWVADDLQEKARIKLDQAFLTGSGTNYVPLGLKNVSNVQTSGSSTTAVSITTPIEMVALLEQADIPMSNVSWLFSPVGKSWILSKAFGSGPWAWADEMLRNKTLNGYKYVTSSTVDYTAATSSDSAYGDFWIGDFSQMLWGVSYDMTLDISREGSYNDGTSTVSAFAKDLTLVRLITSHDFGCRYPKAFVHGIYAKA